ncbi:MAG: hypothetical protein ACOVMM_04185 [Chitinophagaceae bacterium]
MQNKVSINITAADDAAIVAAINTLVSKLQPYLSTLTDEERKGGLKMGARDVSFIQKADAYGAQYSTQIPAFISLPNLKEDVGAINKLNEYLRPLATLQRSVEDTIMLAGSEAMEAALLVYAAIKTCAANNIDGAPEAANDMKERFPGKPRKVAVPKP